MGKNPKCWVRVRFVLVGFGFFPISNRNHACSLRFAWLYDDFSKTPASHYTLVLLWKHPLIIFVLDEGLNPFEKRRLIVRHQNDTNGWDSTSTTENSRVTPSRSRATLQPQSLIPLVDFGKCILHITIENNQNGRKKLMHDDTRRSLN